MQKVHGEEICKRLDFLVSSDKDGLIFVPIS